MKQTHIAILLTLLIATLLAVSGGPTAALDREHTSFPSRISDLAARLTPTLTARAAAPLRAEGGRVTFRWSQGRASGLSLSAESRSVSAVYEAGAGSEALAQGGQAHGLASADFDEDGTPDLVGAYEAASGAGVITLLRGNQDAIYPNSPEARARREQGRFEGSPFREGGAAFALPEGAHFVGAGDFDADGHADVAAGRRGGAALYLMRGDGRGNLAEPERVGLPGALTAFATGDVNRRDGLTDIVVGVGGGEGASALVFESPAGALRAVPEALPLPAPASGLALGGLDDDSSPDIAAAAGRELVTIRGRDRRLSLDEQTRAGTPEAVVSRSGFEFELAGVAVGDFAGDGRADVAVLSADGAVSVLTRSVGAGAETDAGEWRRSEPASLGFESGATGHLMTAKVSGLSKDDLLVTGGGRTHVVTNVAAGSPVGATSKRRGASTYEAAAELSVSAAVAAEGGLAAVLPMRLSPSALSGLVVVGADSKAPTVLNQAAAAVFTVNSAADTSDTNPGNGACADAGDKCTLRAAIEEVNSNPSAGPFEINFNIPGAGVPTITQTNAWFGGQQGILKPVVIDGTTQAAGRVEVIGQAGIYGVLRLRGGNSTVRGLVMSGGAYTISLVVSGNNVIESCYFNTNAGGTAAAASRSSEAAVYVETSNNRIGGTTAAARNVISGSNAYGISVSGGAGNLIQGNYIGTNAAGTAAIGNLYGVHVRFTGAVIGGTAPGSGNLISGNGAGGGNAVYLQSDSASGASAIQGNLVGTNAAGDAVIPNAGTALTLLLPGGSMTVGGTTPAARNVISGNTGHGIYITSTSAQPSYVQGNYIGTSADGTVALPNLLGGVHLDRAGITLGGTAAGAGNLISGNGGDGVYVYGAFGSPGHRVQGNLIGTDVSGTLALPNKGDGVEAYRADNVLVGGTSPEARNVISGNRDNGLTLSGTDATSASPIRVEGNYVGVNRFGAGPLGNGRSGVFTSGNVEGNHVGGTAAGAGNLIAHNVEAGVASDRPWITGPVLSNSIHSNGELGIDVNDDGVSPVHIESNSNRPELLTADNTEAGTVVTGKVYNYGSTEPYTIQFFSNTSCDPSGFGEGRTLVGQVSVPAPTKYAYTNFGATLSPAVPGGATITAVNVRAANQSASDPNLLYTSEFSNCVQLAAPTPTPTPSSTPTPTPTPLQLFVIAPARGGDAAAVTRQLTGQGFLPGAAVRLTRAGQPDIVGAAPSVTNEGTTLTATFDLTGRARGLWSVVVTNPGGQTATLADAFTIGEPLPANVWVNLIGRYTMRQGRTQTFYIAYGNSGDVDAPATLVQLNLPSEISVAASPPSREGARSHAIYDGGLTTVELYLAKVPANSSFHAPVRLTGATDSAHQTMRVEVKALSSPSLDEEFNPPQADPTVAVAPAVLINEPGHLKVNAHVTNGAGQSEDYEFDYSYTAATEMEEPRVTVVESGDFLEYTITATTPDAGQDAAATNPPKGAAGRASRNDSSLQKQTLLARIRKDIPDILDRIADDDYLNQRMRDSLELRLTRCMARRGILEERDLGKYAVEERAKSLKARMDLVARIGGEKTYNPHSDSMNALTKTLDGHWYSRVTDAFVKDVLLSNDARLTELYGKEIIDHVKQYERNRTPGRNSRYEQEARRRFVYAIIRACKCEIQAELGRGSETQIADAPGRPSPASGMGGTTADGHGCGCSNPVAAGPGEGFDKQGGDVPLERMGITVVDKLICDMRENHLDFEFVFSHDPNDKVGPHGFGGERYVTGAEPSAYVVFFENKPEATAPAQDVIITDQLDVTKFDLSTFQLGPVAFGKGRVVAPPPGVSQWATDVDLRPANNLVVRVTAGLNPQTGVVQWKFVSLDPSTMLPTEDPAAGFLPPNKNSPEGEGNVVFTVSPKAGLPTGSEVRNGARIVFDLNAPIDTPQWHNTVDNSRPASHVKALAQAQPYVVFYVNWEGADTGSGVESYDVLVSQNGGAFNLWLVRTTETSAIFVGEPGRTYSFHTVARDRAGNEEAAKTSPEAATTTPNVVVNFIDDARFFVLQHYRDFLGRDPDLSGFDFWTDEIAKCGADAQCREVKRVNVSAAFFLSIEFQETGYLTYRAHKAAFGNLQGKPVPITRAEMLLGAQSLGAGVVVGAENWQHKLEQNKRLYFDQLAASERFNAVHPQSHSPEQYVDALGSNAGGALSQSERDALVAELKANTKTRAQALRAVAEHTELAKAEFNRAFVLMQYFGYLRRDPDSAPDSDFSGYNFWLGKLNEFRGDFIQAEMVKAFLESIEYRQRFGQ